MHASLTQSYSAPVVKPQRVASHPLISQSLAPQRLAASHHPVLKRGYARAKSPFMQEAYTNFTQVDVVRCPICSRQNLSWNRECSWCNSALSSQVLF